MRIIRKDLVDRIPDPSLGLGPRPGPRHYRLGVTGDSSTSEL
jgi:hypothetical protein